MLRSDGLRSLASSSWASMSGSMGVGSAESGLLPRMFFRGLGKAGLTTGEGDRDGSFSFEADVSSFSSSEGSSLLLAGWEGRVFVGCALSLLGVSLVWTE